ncbi:CYCLIN D7;1 [Wolffia australiana]
MEESLFCDEELLDSSPSSPVGSSLATIAVVRGEEDEESFLESCFRRQRRFFPVEGYVEELRRSPELSSLRFKAARWIVLTHRQLDLTLGTAFSALNFFDRFFSMYSHLNWEGWMMELLTVACLTIAAKAEEALISSLHSLPAEGLEHTFHPSTIQQMELTVLTALDWRLNCVTPFSFASSLSHRWEASLRHHLRPLARDRAAEMLTGAALDFEFLQFSPFAVALSAARRAIEELALPDSAAIISDLTRLVPPELIGELEPCHRCMEERVADPVLGIDPSSTSPVTVMLPENGSAVAAAATVFAENNCRKRKNSPAIERILERETIDERYRHT